MEAPLLDGVTVLAPRGAGLEPLMGDGPALAMPFAPERMRALGALGSALLADPQLKRDPAASALAFWLRPARLEALARARREAWAAEPSRLRCPAGRVYHVAPANVDTLFLYSWALSFLCGNVDVVRLPRERSPLMVALLEVVATIAESHPALASAARFVDHPHDAGITGFFSEWCDHRIVWGGDDTVRALRAVPLNPHASERSFAGKVSQALLGTDAVLKADGAALERLASALFRDLFWFSQRACSSPRTLFWIGSDAEVDAAIPVLESALDAEALRRGFRAEAPDAVRRFQFLAEWALEAPLEACLGRDAFLGVRLPDSASWRPDHCGGGLLVHLRLEDAKALLPLLGRKDQTLVHAGLPPEALRTLAQAAGARGLDRLVPVGEALAFEEVWDGFDLIHDFTRIVTLREAP